jgi:hypothetical protein
MFWIFIDELTVFLGCFGMVNGDDMFFKFVAIKIVIL